MISTRKAELNLLLMTAIWGLTFPLVGAAVKSVNPMDFVAIRFLLAACIMFPMIWRDLSATNILTLRYALLLGTVNLGSYYFQGIGLETLGSAESAFITSTTVVIVPFITLIFHPHKPGWLDFFSSMICLGGLYILTGANLSAVNVGELFTFLCATCCALSIMLTQAATHKISNFRLLAFYQILFTAVLALPFSATNHARFVFNHEVVLALLYCATFATILVFYLQVKYQKYTSPSKAALIFCAEPVFAILYSWMLFSENVTLNVLFGGMLILISIMIPDILKLTFEKAQKA